MANTKGFLPHSVEGGFVPAYEYLPASAITPKVGLALSLNGGQLAVASGTTSPAYICMCEKDSAVTAGTILPVIRVTGAITFRTTSSAAFTARKAGEKVTLSSDGMQVTATTTSGVATIVEIEDTAAGSGVLVRF